VTPLPLDLFGAGAAFHHVGLAVRSISDSVGARAEVVHDEQQRVSVAFVDLNGVCVELIEPAAARSPVTLSLQQRQPLVHLCFEVADLAGAISAGRAAGFHTLARPVPAPAFGNRRIAWVYSRTYGLIELLERQ
jgi:methylmalonyl-CoA/ethylmalonyl-CoA epimerase